MHKCNRNKAFFIASVSAFDSQSASHLKQKAVTSEWHVSSKNAIEFLMHRSWRCVRRQRRSHSNVQHVRESGRPIIGLHLLLCTIESCNVNKKKKKRKNESKVRYSLCTASDCTAVQHEARMFKPKVISNTSQPYKAAIDYYLNFKRVYGQVLAAG